jgi:hypothetical protein
MILRILGGNVAKARGDCKGDLTVEQEAVWQHEIQRGRVP